MNQSFEEIVEQIKNGIIKFHNSYTTFDEHIPDNINQLIYVITKDYIINLLIDLNSFNVSFDFKTNKGYVSIGKTIDDELEATGICFDIFANRVSSCLINIDFPMYDKNTLSLINDNIITCCEEFDVERKLKNLRQYYSHCAPGLMAEGLIEDKKFFNNFAKNLRTYGPEKIRRENS